MTPNMTQQAQSETCLVGQLETWNLAEVLMWLHENQRTAMVRVGIGLEAGVLFVSHGQLYRAEWGRFFGEQALYGLLSLPSGSFSLIQRDVPTPRPNINTPTPQLLLQCVVALDESRRARGVA